MRIFGSLLLVIVLAGCVSSTRRERYLEQIEPGSLPKLTAFRGATNLEIRYPFHGRDAYAAAHWPGEIPGSPEYQYRYAVLSFEKQPHGERRSLTKHGERLSIQNAGNGKRSWTVSFRV